MKNWFALYVQPRKEKVVEKELLRNNYEAFLPIKKCLRQWKDRKKMVEMPLIPSYVFVFIEVKDMWDILKINGCVKFVWFDKKPCPIPQYQIESLKLIQENEIDIELDPKKTSNSCVSSCVSFASSIAFKTTSFKIE